MSTTLNRVTKGEAVGAQGHARALGATPDAHGVADGATARADEGNDVCFLHGGRATAGINGDARQAGARCIDHHAGDASGVSVTRLESGVHPEARAREVDEGVASLVVKTVINNQTTTPCSWPVGRSHSFTRSI